MKNKTAKVISITSGKGGVGKTHTTVNLGYSLVKKGARVLLIDADLGLANINVLLGFQPGATIAELLSGKGKVDDILVSHPLGFEVLPAASGITDVVTLPEEQRITLLSQLSGLNEQYDFILVDTAAGIGESVLYFNSAADEVVVVIVPEPTSITDAYALIKVLESEKGIRHFSILVNQNQLGTDGKQAFAKLATAAGRFLNVSLKYLGAVTSDPVVSEAVRTQQPFSELYPGAKPSLDIAKIAEKMIENQNQRILHGGMQLFLDAVGEQ